MTAALSPSQRVIFLAGSALPARGLQVIAKLGVADALGDEPATADDLAKAVDVDADALHRLLRLIASHGIFEDLGDRRYGHNDASQFLRSQHPQSIGAFVRRMSIPRYWHCYEHLEYSLRTGRPAMELVEPEGAWAYFAKRPEESRLFGEGGATKAKAQIAAILKAYDFSGLEVIADVGGGPGYLIRAILEKNPGASGIVYDLPHVIEENPEAAERLTGLGGDFFKDTLPVCDAYMMMNVLHDWSDAETVAILKNIARVAKPTSKVLVLETLISNLPGPDYLKRKDVSMLVVTGGRERTRDEFETLLNEAGFQVERVVPTEEGTQIIEAVLKPKAV